jgi:hypothetical protein
MNVRVVIVLATLFFVYSAWRGGSVLSMLALGGAGWGRYLRMALYGFIGLSLYQFVSRHPGQSASLLYHAQELIKYIPIDKQAGAMLTPVFNFARDTGAVRGVMEGMTGRGSGGVGGAREPWAAGDVHLARAPTAAMDVSPQTKRMLNSGGAPGATTNRSVSGTKKKFVAARQKWHCAGCGAMLDHTFEVDHIQELQYGGTNHVDNLEALCRNCHGKKTVSSFI